MKRGVQGGEEGENDGGEVSIVLLRPRGLGASPSASPRSLLLLLLFFITIFAFPTFCFMLMVAPCCYPLHQPVSLSLPLFFSISLSPPRPLTAPPPISSRRPSLRMHGLGELLAFCLEFKKFFHLPLLLRPVALRPAIPLPLPPFRRATLVVVVTYLFRFVSCTPTCTLRSILSRKHKRGKI